MVAENRFGINGKSVLITGASPRLGLEIAQDLAMDKESFVADPHEFRVESPINLVFKHNEDQTNVLGAYVGQYGRSLDGLGRILMRTQFYDLIRIAKSADTSLQFLSTQTT